MPVRKPHSYTLDEIKARLAETGATKVKVAGVDIDGMPLLLARGTGRCPRLT
jgi:hypothetical protein